MTALLFGSIGTIVDTSELQRQSFNQAFVEQGLDWKWDRDEYVAMLATSGGTNRIAAYADSKGVDVDAEAIHASKSTIFRTVMDGAQLTARPGVADTIRRAKADGVKVGLVTTTSNENVASMIGAVDGIDLVDFDVTLSLADVEQPKPDPAVYTAAVDRLGLERSRCIAVEDNVGGVASAVAAGLVCVAFPNENTAGHDFSAAAAVVETIDLAAVTAHLDA